MTKSSLSGLIVASVVTIGIAFTEMLRRSHGVPSLPKFIAALGLLFLVFDRIRVFRKLEVAVAEITSESVQQRRLVDRIANDTIYVIYAYLTAVWFGIFFAGQ